MTAAAPLAAVSVADFASRLVELRDEHDKDPVRAANVMATHCDDWLREKLSQGLRGASIGVGVRATPGSVSLRGWNRTTAGAMRVVEVALFVDVLDAESLALEVEWFLRSLGAS